MYNEDRKQLANQKKKEKGKAISFPFSSIQIHSSPVKENKEEKALEKNAKSLV